MSSLIPARKLSERKTHLFNFDPFLFQKNLLSALLNVFFLINIFIKAEMGGMSVTDANENTN